MLNVFSFELKRLMGRFTTYIFFAIALLAEGFFIVNFNLYEGRPAIEYTTEFVSVIMMFVIPMLTFPSFSKDRVTGFESSVSALGISNTQRIFGKLLSCETVIAISTAPMVIMMFVLMALSEINILSGFIGIIWYLLFGCAVTSLGIFISSVTPKPLFSALITYASVILMYVCELIYPSVYLNLTASFFTLTLLALGLAVMFMFITKKDYAWLGVFIGLEAVIVILRFALPNALVRLGSSFLDFAAIRRTLSGFCYGLFDISSLFRLIAFSALMLILCKCALSSEKYGIIK